MNILKELILLDKSIANTKELLVGKPKTHNIYAGTEEYVQFFEQLNSTLGLGLDYEIVIVDGEYEINVTI